jgi:hypothetical protein
MFSAKFFNPNGLVKPVYFGQTTVNWAITSKTSPTTPNDPLWSALGQVGQN